MTIDEARSALIAILQDIQARSGLACPPLTGSSVPPKVLDKFTSPVWPAATTLVGRKLGVSIPHDVHIFGKKGAALLSIDQSAKLICEKAKPKDPVKVAA
jgi:hypothetical protein